MLALSTPSKVLRWTAEASFLAVLAGCGGGGDPGAPLLSSLTLLKPDSYVLKWSDEFEQNGALGSAWDYDLGATLLGGTVWGNSEKQFYTNDAANVFNRDGVLTIQAVARDTSIAPTGLGLLATSARIKTDTADYYNALNGTPYGFYEISAKVPCVRGAWPAIWMMGKDGVWPDRGEVDIMEWFGAYFADQPNQVQSAIHTRNNSGSTALYGKQNVSNMCRDFQRFQLHWTSDEILMGVNGIPTFSYKKPRNSNMADLPYADWPFDKPAYLLLNVAVGGNLGGSVNVNDLTAMKMQVDYVRVWQKP